MTHLGDPSEVSLQLHDVSATEQTLDSQVVSRDLGCLWVCFVVHGRYLVSELRSSSITRSTIGLLETPNTSLTCTFKISGGRVRMIVCSHSRPLTQVSVSLEPAHRHTSQKHPPITKAEPPITGPSFTAWDDEFHSGHQA